MARVRSLTICSRDIGRLTRRDVDVGVAIFVARV